MGSVFVLIRTANEWMSMLSATMFTISMYLPLSQVKVMTVLQRDCRLKWQMLSQTARKQLHLNCLWVRLSQMNRAIPILSRMILQEKSMLVSVWKVTLTSKAHLPISIMKTRQTVKSNSLMKWQVLPNPSLASLIPSMTVRQCNLKMLVATTLNSKLSRINWQCLSSRHFGIASIPSPFM